MTKDYYSILQVTQTAQIQEIRASYRKLALKYHPDKNKDADAPTKFQEIGEAYEVLSNEEARASYDRSRLQASPPTRNRRSYRPQRTPSQEESFDDPRTFFGNDFNFRFRTADEVFAEFFADVLAQHARNQDSLSDSFFESAFSSSFDDPFFRRSSLLSDPFFGASPFNRSLLRPTFDPFNQPRSSRKGFSTVTYGGNGGTIFIATSSSISPRSSRIVIEEGDFRRGQRGGIRSPSPPQHASRNFPPAGRIPPAAADVALHRESSNVAVPRSAPTNSSVDVPRPQAMGSRNQKSEREKELERERRAKERSCSVCTIM